MHARVLFPLMFMAQDPHIPEGRGRVQGLELADTLHGMRDKYRFMHCCVEWCKYDNGVTVVAWIHGRIMQKVIRIK